MPTSQRSVEHRSGGKPLRVARGWRGRRGRSFPAAGWGGARCGNAARNGCVPVTRRPVTWVWMPRAGAAQLATAWVLRCRRAVPVGRGAGRPRCPDGFYRSEEVTGRRTASPGGWGTTGQVEHQKSQNHRIVGVGRDLCGSSSPTPLPKQGHLQ